LVDVQFKNCTGLSPRHFYKYKIIEGKSHLPTGLTKTAIDALKIEEMQTAIAQSSLYDKDKEYLQQVIANPNS
jgi:phosphodiesterase/alkaline phosphatase D-like protein